MSKIKQLAKQTLWYGMSNVVAKLSINLLTPILTYILSSPDGVISLGRVSLIYSYFAFLNILFTYGMETAYFKFNNSGSHNKHKIFNSSFGSLLLSTAIFCITLFVFNSDIEQFLEFDHHVEYVNFAIVILFFDTIQTVPFARLRNENKPRKYAFIKIAGVVIYIVAILFFMVFLPKLAVNNVDSIWGLIAKRHSVVTFILFSNLIQTVFTFFALYKEWYDFDFKIDITLWRNMFKYSYPMIIIGLAGMINEVIDRQMLIKLIDNTKEYAQTVQSIYSQNYKFSIVVTMFITAFRMAAEPFFFSTALDKNAPEIYAKIMKWFVITCCIAFLLTTLFLNDIWILWLGPSYRSGKFIVPILLLANVFTGIYYNLSTWYKVTNKMGIGVIITLSGAAITFVGNFLFISKFEMLASAWTTLICYLSMATMCYVWGRKYYPVPYPIRKILMYLISIVILYFIQYEVSINFSDNNYILLRLFTGIVSLFIFFLLVFMCEKKELENLPISKRLVKILQFK